MVLHPRTTAGGLLNHPKTHVRLKHQMTETLFHGGHGGLVTALEALCKVDFVSYWHGGQVLSFFASAAVISRKSICLCCFKMSQNYFLVFLNMLRIL